MEINPLLPTPESTLVILLGASEWPNATEFQGSDAFANSAIGLKEYFLDPLKFGIIKENLLDLFNSSDSSDDIDRAIIDFIDERLLAMRKSDQAIKDVLIYFVGHGGFSGRDYNYYLAIRRTRANNPIASSINIMSLAHSIKEKARYLRRIIILDCCFAASASQYFQSSEPTRIAIDQMIDAFKVQDEGTGFPTKGTSLLCSSRHNAPSLIAPDGKYTMFSEALLHTLHSGNSHLQSNISLHAVARMIEDYLHSKYGDMGAPRPEVHSPDQSEGDVALIPFFPNLYKKLVSQNAIVSSTENTSEIVPLSDSNKEHVNTNSLAQIMIEPVEKSPVNNEELEKQSEIVLLKNRLKYEREQNQWTQSDVAKKMGITDATVNLWECGIILPSLSECRKLCELFEKNHEELGLLVVNVEVTEVSIGGAVHQALNILGKRRDEVEITVLQQPKRGLYTFGNKAAHVSVMACVDTIPPNSKLVKELPQIKEAQSVEQAANQQVDYQYDLKPQQRQDDIYIIEDVNQDIYDNVSFETINKGDKWPFESIDEEKKEQIQILNPSEKRAKRDLLPSQVRSSPRLQQSHLTWLSSLLRPSEYTDEPFRQELLKEIENLKRAEVNPLIIPARASRALSVPMTINRFNGSDSLQKPQTIIPARATRPSVPMKIPARKVVEFKPRQIYRISYSWRALIKNVRRLVSIKNMFVDFMGIFVSIVLSLYFVNYFSSIPLFILKGYQLLSIGCIGSVFALLVACCINYIFGTTKIFILPIAFLAKLACTKSWVCIAVYGSLIAGFWGAILGESLLYLFSRAFNVYAAISFSLICSVALPIGFFFIIVRKTEARSIADDVLKEVKRILQEISENEQIN